MVHNEYDTVNCPREIYFSFAEIKILIWIKITPRTESFILMLLNLCVHVDFGTDRKRVILFPVDYMIQTIMSIDVHIVVWEGIASL